MNLSFTSTAILFGALAGIMVAERANVVLGVVVAFVVTVAAWFVIRAAENALRRKIGSGTDAGASESNEKEK